MADNRSRGTQLGRSLHTLGLISLAILSFTLPLELETPWVQFRLFEVTNVEVCLAIVLVVALVQWVADGRPFFRLPKTWIWLGIIFLVALLISSFSAPIYRDNAIKAAFRTFSGIALMLATIIIVRSKRDLSLVAAALCAGTILAVIVGLSEVVQGDAFSWLDSFRASVTVTGPFLRLSGPFDYANQAAMYLEAMIPLMVALSVVAWRSRRRLRASALGLGVLIMVQAAMSTYSRSAMVIVMIFALSAIIGAIWIRKRHPDDFDPVPIILGVGALVIVILNLIADPVWKMRFSSEGDVGWYMVELRVPEKLSLIAEHEYVLAVTVINDSAFTLQSEGTTPVFLAARWVHPSSQLAEQGRWSFPQPLAPGESLTMEVPLRAPDLSGEFKLVWDLVQEGVTWFGAKTGQETKTLVSISGSDSISDGTRGNTISAQELVDEWHLTDPIPGRQVLWRTARNLWLESPFFGIGLDNYRHRYGEELGYDLWNQTIHSNNWYIETIVSLGLIGALPFLLWLGVLLVDLLRRARSGGIWTLALSAALFAYIIHGFLDYFLLFNATALLFWILVGLWVALIYHIKRTKTTHA